MLKAETEVKATAVKRISFWMFKIMLIVVEDEASKESRQVGSVKSGSSRKASPQRE